MSKSNHQEKFLELRARYPFFEYKDFSFSLSEKGLEIEFLFNLAEEVRFRPTLFIPRKSWFLPDKDILEFLPNIIFNIGMIEMVSYWKAACPPVISIKPGHLEPEQIDWWKKCYFNGLGEFFYLNSITTSQRDFVSLESPVKKNFNVQRIPVNRGIIVPVGGGKDSAVTLELLGSIPGTIPMILNPRGASLETIYVRGLNDTDYIEIRRTLDPKLLELNEKGFLNGHTPFSALLAFLTVLSAILSGKKFIALSNESSANETTIENTNINHQYSKTLEFETDFQEYISHFVTPDIEYFSFLRPLNELQIGYLFAGFPKYHGVFKSCNAGSKDNTWCGKCAKCLFTYIILSPFLSRAKLKEIFGKDLLDEMELLTVLDQLTGITTEKPFDCVGTMKEVNLALCEIIKQSGNGELPGLLNYYRSLPGYCQYREIYFHSALNQFDIHHHVPEDLYRKLKSALHD